MSDEEEDELLNAGTGPDAGDDDLLSDDDIASILEGASLDGDDGDSLPGMGAADDESDDLAAILAPESGDGQSMIDDLLDQSGIDALMRDSETAGKIILRWDGTRMTGKSDLLIEEYDFANPHFLSETQMRRVRLRHEQFIFNAASRLSMQLQTDFALRMSRLETQPYQNFTDNISNPSHIVLFRLNQIRGVGVVAMGARLAMTIVDRLLGGGGHSVRQERFLSDLEVVLLEDFIQLLLAQWCAQWSDFEKLHAEIVGYENHGRFLQTAPRDAQVLILSMEAVLGDCSETIQIGVPYYSVEPIIKRMQEQADANNQPVSSSARKNWWSSCDHIDVEVSAQWPAFECEVKDLLCLRKGDILKLSPALLEKTEIWCNNTLRFSGKIGTEDGKVAVEVRERVSQTPED
ncbi:MAG: flagellar motor switch protein FliM [Opitutales bacterium]